MSNDSDKEQEEPGPILPTYPTKKTYTCERCGQVNNKGVRLCTNCGSVICSTCKD